MQVAKRSVQVIGRTILPVVESIAVENIPGRGDRGRRGRNKRTSRIGASTSVLVSEFATRVNRLHIPAI